MVEGARHASRRAVALTFDDGPCPGTDQLLSILAEERVAATFFVLGHNAERHPDIMARLARSPHVELGSHTVSHVDLTRSAPEVVADEINDNIEVIQRLTGQRVGLFRPPWGRHDRHVDAAARTAGQSLILYGLDSGDWSHRSVTETIERVVNEAAHGDIILLHDTLASTIEASRPLIRALKAREFELVTVSELLGRTTPGRAYDGLITRRVRLRRHGMQQIKMLRIRVRRLLSLTKALNRSPLGQAPESRGR